MKSFGQSRDEVEAKWIDSLRRRHVWMASLAAYSDQLVFFACTVLTILASVKVLIRRKKYPEPDEEGESSVESVESVESEAGARGGEGGEGDPGE